MEKYIEVFIEVCKQVFIAMGNIQITAKPPFILGKDSPNDWDISTVIGLSGDAKGAVALSMTETTALRIASLLSGFKYKEMNDDVVDVVGEIINIIAGQAKQKLEADYTLQISLPIVTKGKGHQLAWPGKTARILCVPFTLLEKETFYFSAILELKT